jgi:hypothetical protein
MSIQKKIKYLFIATVTTSLIIVVLVIVSLVEVYSQAAIK